MGNTHAFFWDGRRSLFGEEPWEIPTTENDDPEFLDQIGYGPEEQPW